MIYNIRIVVFCRETILIYTYCKGQFPSQPVETVVCLLGLWRSSVKSEEITLMMCRCRITLYQFKLGDIYNKRPKVALWEMWNPLPLKLDYRLHIKMDTSALPPSSYVT